MFSYIFFTSGLFYLRSAADINKRKKNVTIPWPIIFIPVSHDTHKLFELQMQFSIFWWFVDKL